MMEIESCDRWYNMVMVDRGTELTIAMWLKVGVVLLRPRRHGTITKVSVF